MAYTYPKAVPHTPPTMCMKFATLSWAKMISYTCWPRYSAATSSMVTGMPPEKPDSDASMMSMNTMPEAPSRAVWGKSTHCRTPEMSAVSRMPLSRGPLPYFSSIGGPMTSSRSNDVKLLLRNSYLAMVKDAKFKVI